jgi:hypothetical protein
LSSTIKADTGIDPFCFITGVGCVGRIVASIVGQQLKFRSSVVDTAAVEVIQGGAFSRIASCHEWRCPDGRRVNVVVFHRELDCFIFSCRATGVVPGIVNTHAEAELCPFALIGRSGSCKAFQVVHNFGRGVREHTSLVANLVDGEPGLIPVLVDPVATPSDA